MNLFFKKTRKPIILSVAFERPYSVFMANGSVMTDQNKTCYGLISNPIKMITEELDALPMLIPTNFPRDQIKHIIKKADAVVLPGGNSNVNPSLYGSTPCNSIEKYYDKARDCVEIEVLEAAFAQKKPILGICRGMQLINVWLGGTMRQSFPQDHPINHGILLETLGTNNEKSSDHALNVAAGSNLENWLGGQTHHLFVNSGHKQGIDKIGNGLLVEASAPDGVVEAFRYDSNKQFLYGVQWHPDFNPLQPASVAVLRAFKQSL